MQHAAIDPDGAAGQRERIDFAVIGHLEGVGIRRTWGSLSQSLPDAPDVRGDVGVANLRGLLAHLRVLRAANLDFLRHRDEREPGESNGGNWFGGSNKTHPTPRAAGAPGIYPGEDGRDRA